MTATDQQRLGKTLWAIADQLRGAMAADDFRDYMLAFLFLRYLSDNYEVAAKKELGSDYPAFAAGDPRVPLAVWYANNPGDVVDFEKQMRRKVHYVIRPDHLWANIANLARNDSDELLETLKKGFDYIENESFDSTFQGLFSEINLYSEKLGKTQPAKNKMLCGVVKEIAKGLNEFSTIPETRNNSADPPTSTPSATLTNTLSASSPPAPAKKRASSIPRSKSPPSSRASSPSTARSLTPAR